MWIESIQCFPLQQRLREQTKRCKLTECGDCGCRPLCGASVARHPALTRTHTILGIRCIQQNLMIRHPCTFVWYALCTLNPKCRCCRFSAPQATFWNALCSTIAWQLCSVCALAHEVLILKCPMSTKQLPTELCANSWASGNLQRRAGHRLLLTYLAPLQKQRWGHFTSVSHVWPYSITLHQLHLIWWFYAVDDMLCSVDRSLCCRLWLSILNLVQKLSWE